MRPSYRRPIPLAVVVARRKALVQCPRCGIAMHPNGRSHRKRHVREVGRCETLEPCPSPPGVVTPHGAVSCWLHSGRPAEMFEPR